MQIKKIAAAVGVSVMLGAASQAQAAESLLFPYFSVGNGVYSFLSLQSAFVGGSSTAAQALHYVWNYKEAATGINNTASCTHYDRAGSLTDNDLLIQTVEDPGVAGGNHLNMPTLFGDTTGSAGYLNVPTTTGRNLVGMLTVHNSSATAFEGNFYGQMMVADTATGLVYAYKGMNNMGSTVEGTFNDAFTSKTGFMMSWYPAAYVSTTWYASITGAGMAVGDWNGQSTFSNGEVNNYAYNQNESPASGFNAVRINCLGTLTRANLLNEGQQDFTKNGGRMFAVAGGLLNGATGALLTKIEAISGSRYVGVSSENAFPNMPY